MMKEIRGYETTKMRKNQLKAQGSKKKRNWKRLKAIREGPRMEEDRKERSGNEKKKIGISEQEKLQ